MKEPITDPDDAKTVLQNSPSVTYITSTRETESPYALPHFALSELHETVRFLGGLARTLSHREVPL